MSDLDPIDRDMIGAVYVITNLSNGKRYIGRSVDPDRRWRAHRLAATKMLHRQAIHAAMAKHGADNFSFEVLSWHRTNAELMAAEVDAVRSYGAVAPNGYNITPGGEDALHFHSIMTDEQRRAVSERSRAQLKGLSKDERIRRTTKAKETLGPAKRRELAIYAASKQSKQHLRERMLGLIAQRTPEQHSENARRANASMTAEQRSMRSVAINRDLGEQGRSAKSVRANASRTPEQRREIARKVHASMTPEQRSEKQRKGMARLSAEQLTQKALRAWETRRLRAIQEGESGVG